MNDTYVVLIRNLQRSDTSLCRDTDLFHTDFSSTSYQPYFQINIFCPEERELNDPCPGLFFLKPILSTNETERHKEYMTFISNNENWIKQDMLPDVIKLIESMTTRNQIKGDIHKVIGAKKRVNLTKVCEGIGSWWEENSKKPGQNLNSLSLYSSWAKIEKEHKDLIHFIKDPENFPTFVDLLLSGKEIDPEVKDWGNTLANFVATLAKTQRHRTCLLPYFQYDIHQIKYLET